jgi:small subunit ribosomal protein S9
MTNLEELKKVKAGLTEQANNTVEKVQKPVLDKLSRAYATGKRKNSIARLWVKRGKGLVTINGKTIENYFPREALIQVALDPLRAVQMLDQIDIFCTVLGGGHSGQSGSVRHALAKALVAFDPEFRATLKAKKMLTRDSRVVERKKPGQRKARKKTQFSKR